MLSRNCTEFNSSTQACAECFMSVSTASPAMMRKNELSQCFVSLLCDKSRWVCTQKFHFLSFAILDIGAQFHSATISDM